MANCVTTEAVHLGSSTIMGYASLDEEKAFGVPEGLIGHGEDAD